MFILISMYENASWIVSKVERKKIKVAYIMDSETNKLCVLDTVMPTYPLEAMMIK